MNALGIDPGTGSMDLLLLDDESIKVLYEEVVPRSLVTGNPYIIIEKIDKLRKLYGVDSIAAPSGYGIPYNNDNIIDYIIEATFVNESDSKRIHQIHGLRRIMIELAKSGLPVYFTPGVVHLPTIPTYRKANRIDMGTADKIFTVANALYYDTSNNPSNVEKSSFIVVEAGKAYTAALAVEKGQIIDGVGGTGGGPGFLGMGCMDSELAYALSSIEPGFSRSRLFEGGAASYAGIKDTRELSLLVENNVDRGLEAFEMISETIVKNVFQLLPSFTIPPKRVYVSGRLFREENIGDRLVERLETSFNKIGYNIEVLRLPRLGRVTKEGASGAALLASGYAEGRFSWIVDALKLKNSSGSIFDNILLEGVPEKAKLYFRRIGRDIL